MIAGLVVIATAVLVVWSLIGDGGQTHPRGMPAPVVARDGGAAPLMGGDFSPIADSARQAVDLADAPTAFLQVSDRETGAPVIGASVHRYQGGEVLNFTDDRGCCGVPLQKPAQLVIAADGYLLRLCPTQPHDSKVDNPQLVQLLPDRYTLRCRFHFVDASGAPVAGVHVRFRPQQPIARASPGPAVPLAVQRGDAVLQRAWTEHCMIANQAAFTEMRVQLGHLNSSRVHTLRGDDMVRFCSSGTYELDAATDDGLVGRAAFQAETVVDDPLTVRLQHGDYVQGRIRDAVSGAPIAAAQVHVRGGDPLDCMATTAADGSFRLGPLAAGAVELELRHLDHGSTITDPIVVGSGETLLQMPPLPAASLRGRVRSKPQLLPLAGATVSAIDALGGAANTTTADDGTFALRIGGKDAVRLSIAAPGFLPYGELVQPDGAYQEYELWPADTATRLASGMTGVLSGLVVDANGHPVPGIAVRFYPDQPVLPQVQGDRRVLDGGALALPLAVTAGNDGAFRLETQHLGTGALVPMDGKTQPPGGLRVEVIGGKTVGGLHVLAQGKP